ncbi:PHB depolymerase family esterase [Streptomyces sp. NPDC007157]|uniref:alpha/beta hydrolase family esterase n=1 Tax=Streptomyces sp. NPDC007157 TaxID=3154681 RepID=UPI0033CE6F7A
MIVRALPGALEAGGLTRTYVQVSADRRDRSARSGRPLVVVFHGTGQTGRSVRRFSGRSFDTFAAGTDAVVVYPDGYRRDWNGARDIGTPARRRGIDDVGFFTDLVEAMATTHATVQERVYVIGFSLGGQMVMRLLHEVPKRLAGAAIISSTLPAAYWSQTPPSADTAVPVLLFHGTADPLAPYDGGVVSVRGLFPRGLHRSAEETAAYYAARNGITAPPVTEPLHHADGSEVTTVTTTTYGGDSTTPVTLFTVHGGGHQIPNPAHTPMPWFWGRSCPDLVCADLIGRHLLPATR